MKSLKTTASLAVMLLLSMFLKAQDAETMIKEFERAKAYTKEYLDANTDAGYALKPTPQMRSFAEQMLHLADANYLFSTAATGEKAPVSDLEKGTTDKSKANVTKLVMDSYDYVIASIKKLTPAQMQDKIKIFGRFELTKGEAFTKDFEHQTHHRGQTTVYLRLAGVTPPQEKLF